MRVGLFTREYPPNVYGGAGVHVEYLSRELARHIEVEVHCFGDQHAHGAGWTVAGHAPDQRIVASQAKFKGALEALSVNLDSILELDRVNVVHTHTWYASMAGFWAKKLYGMPLVLTTHSLEPLRAWKAEQLGSGYQMSSWMEKTAIENADAVIAVSHGTKADIVRAYPAIQPERIHVIYNGIDLAEYRRDTATNFLTAFGVDPSRPFVLFVGRITRQKGVTHLVDAIHHLPADTQVVLCAGAPDTPEIATEMRDKVTALQATHPRVIWIEKMVSKPEVIQLYSHAAVFCCPSIYEPFGIINLEAMACETAVVASATGGIKEVVVPGETGILVPLPQDPDTNAPLDPASFARDLASAITQVLANKELQARFGRAGRRRVEETFSWTAIAEQTIALYREVIAAAGGSCPIRHNGSMPAPEAVTGPLGLTVEVTIREGGEAAAAQHLQAMAEHWLEPGCLAYNVFRAQGQTARFLIYELYRDAAALDAHHATEHFATHATAGLYPLVAERRYELWDPLTVK